MNKFLMAGAVLLAVWFTAGDALAYSYAEKEDPMVILFKESVAAAKKGDWGKVRANVEKGIAKRKAEKFEAEHLKPRFDRAIKAKDVSAMAESFANLVYLSIREKLHANIKDNFANYKNARKRLQLARKSYQDVLDGNVKKNAPANSKKIEDSFKKALAALGAPGVFGMGKKPSDPGKYKKAIENIEGLIEKSFPGFSK